MWFTMLANFQGTLQNYHTLQMINIQLLCDKYSDILLRTRRVLSYDKQGKYCYKPNKESTVMLWTISVQSYSNVRWWIRRVLLYDELGEYYYVMNKESTVM